MTTKPAVMTFLDLERALTKNSNALGALSTAERLRLLDEIEAWDEQMFIKTRLAIKDRFGLSLIPLDMLKDCCKTSLKLAYFIYAGMEAQRFAQDEIMDIITYNHLKCGFWPDRGASEHERAFFFDAMNTACHELGLAFEQPEYFY